MACMPLCGTWEILYQQHDVWNHFEMVAACIGFVAVVCWLLHLGDKPNEYPIPQSEPSGLQVQKVDSPTLGNVGMLDVLEHSGIPIHRDMSYRHPDTMTRRECGDEQQQGVDDARGVGSTHRPPMATGIHSIPQ